MQNDFIKKLISEKKIKLVPASPDISKAYSEKSLNYLKGAKILYKEGLYDQSIVNSYYSMYYKVMSLFHLIGLKCENNTGTILLLKDLFGIDNEVIKEAKTERIDKQYYTNEITPVEAKEILVKSEEFIINLDAFIDRLDEKEYQTIRKSFAFS